MQRQGSDGFREQRGAQQANGADHSLITRPQPALPDAAAHRLAVGQYLRGDIGCRARDAVPGASSQRRAARAVDRTMRHATVFLDPDGTFPENWVGVIVDAPTGVFYANQCGGTACLHREREGYYVPLSGVPMNPDEPRLGVAELRVAFHGPSGACHWDLATDGAKLSADQLALLASAVARIPFWSGDGQDTRGPLRLDEARLDELAEAWVPILLPEGEEAILVWGNCD